MSGSQRFYQIILFLTLPLVAAAVIYLLVEGDYAYALTMALIGIGGVGALIWEKVRRRS